MITEEQRSALHQRLMDEQQRLNTEIANLRTGVSSDTFQENEGDAFDQHPADEGSELFEREKNMTVIQTLEVSLDEVNQALRKVDNGTYGQCERCGQPIAPKRLEAMPEAVHCIQCQSLIDRENQVGARA